MALQNQCHIYTVQTNAFYTEKEQQIDTILWFLRQEKKKMLDKYNIELKKYIEFCNILNTRNVNIYKNKNNIPIEYREKTVKGIQKKIPKIMKITKTTQKQQEDKFHDFWWNDYRLSEYRHILKSIKKHKEMLKNEIESNVGITRTISERFLSKKNIISIFESALTRYCDIKTNELTDKLMVVRVYYFGVFESLVKNGFYRNVYDSEGNLIDRVKYIAYSSSAGQIRTKKFVMIREDIFNQIHDKLMVGLTVDKINNNEKEKGVNINKYLAYLSLNNSATDVWKKFDIDKTIVVDDLETTVTGLVDNIDIETFDITRMEKDINIEHTDGCGMVLYPKYKKNFMCRLGWIKGLLTPFAFYDFIKEQDELEPNINHAIVTDIYGKEYDIIKDGIEVIFTKSQFKMWKYYNSWEEYKHYFKKFGCHASICNEEEADIKNSYINYQMLQTLTDITDEEIYSLVQKTNKEIKDITSSVKTMLNILGATNYNKNKNYLQESLMKYPEMLQDNYCKEIIKSVKAKRIKEAKAGKIDVNGKFTFVVPDMYAFCEYLFLKEKNPVGLLGNGQVSCSMYKNDKELDCLRSPHLYKEHAIRTNVQDINTNKWFVTKGCYTSIYDLISKILMFDVDGDKFLIVDNPIFVNIAKRNMKDIVPLYYEMKKAKSIQLNSDSIYKSLVKAFTGGSIGEISNSITKIWNSKSHNIKAIQVLCCLNNFKIDEAKTLFMPVVPKHIHKQLSVYKQQKLPHFFIYAKNKELKQVNNVSESFVDKLNDVVENPRIYFDYKKIEKFDYNMLKRNKRATCSAELLEFFNKLDFNRRMLSTANKDEKYNNLTFLYQEMKKELLNFMDCDEVLLCDMLVDGLYKSTSVIKKQALWEMFGNIILKNISFNLRSKYGSYSKVCLSCGFRFESDKNMLKYCDNCREVEYSKRKK